MAVVLRNQTGSDDRRRQQIFAGDIFVLSPRAATLALCHRVQRLIEDAFGDHPTAAEIEALAPAQAIAAMTALKHRVANDLEANELLRALLSDLGCDLRRTFLHRLFLRVVPSKPGPADEPRLYHAPLHRDVWLANPHCQINWWMPLYEIDSNSCVVFHPSYWQRPVANTSREFDYLTYRARLGARGHAASSGANLREAMSAPHAVNPIDTDDALRLVCSVGSLLIFSAAHLHASVPNTSGSTRFSLDFRTVALDDLVTDSGAPWIDTFCSGTSLVDFRRLDDGSPVPPSLFGRARDVATME